MTTINLKDFYYWYIVDELVKVPDEVAEELIAPCGTGALQQGLLFPGL